MSDAGVVIERSPEAIAARIAGRRRELDRKLEKLGERLDPRVRIKELRADLSGRAPTFVAWSAVTAIAAGLWMAQRGWTRVRSSEMEVWTGRPFVS